ncbi:MAG: hypothetical protein GY866_34490 [Proteobacteria bacterium]|nr:hypothetical protein [Pseudomonadota bacterium]
MKAIRTIGDILIALPTIVLIFFFMAAWILLLGNIVQAKTPWTTKLKPGDTVCIYDIGKGDDLIHNKSNDSLKYWYRADIGNQKSRYELRPMARNLQMRLLWPGLKVVETDGTGRQWYSADLVVVKGGRKPGKKGYPVELGDNVLLRERGRTIVVNWQILHFEKARFKKKIPALGCRRKYDKY